jgi:hypothetical protein
MDKCLKGAEQKLKRAKGTDAQTKFDTEIEAIRNFHIITPPRGKYTRYPDGRNLKPCTYTAY